MFSIGQSVGDGKWIQAAEACSSAISLFSQKEQADIALFILEIVDPEVKSAYDKSRRITNKSLSLNDEPEFQGSQPWIVHIEDAREDIIDIYENLNADRNEIAARTSYTILEIIFSLQVFAWASTDKSSFELWASGKKPHTVFENDTSKEVAIIHWMLIDKLIRNHRLYINKDDKQIYKFRPSVERFRRILKESSFNT